MYLEWMVVKKIQPVWSHFRIQLVDKTSAKTAYAKIKEGMYKDFKESRNACGILFQSK